MSNQIIEPGSRVELRSECQGVYNLVAGGCEGTVVKRMIDDDGFAMVWIQWDKSHWLHQGEPDGWTYESHFRTIVPPAQVTPREQTTPQEDIDKYIDVIEAAFNECADSEAFIVITSRPTDQENLFSSYLFFAGFSKESLDVVRAQIMSLAEGVFGPDGNLDDLGKLGPDDES